MKKAKKQATIRISDLNDTSKFEQIWRFLAAKTAGLNYDTVSLVWSFSSDVLRVWCFDSSIGISEYIESESVFSKSYVFPALRKEQIENSDEEYSDDDWSKIDMRHERECRVVNKKLRRLIRNSLKSLPKKIADVFKKRGFYLSDLGPEADTETMAWVCGKKTLEKRSLDYMSLLKQFALKHDILDPNRIFYFEGKKLKRIQFLNQFFNFSDKFMKEFEKLSPTLRLLKPETIVLIDEAKISPEHKARLKIALPDSTMVIWNEAKLDAFRTKLQDKMIKGEYVDAFEEI